MSTGADAIANSRGGGALEGGDLRLLEDDGECGGTLVSDLVARETANHGRGCGTVRDQACQWALTQALGRTAGSWFEVVEHASA